MQYLVGIVGEESKTHNWEEISPEQMQAMFEQMNAYNKELEEAGVMIGGGGLDRAETATTIHYGPDGKREVVDGPFAETKEWLAGFWVFECANLDEALAWAKKIPFEEGKVEVRPLITEEDDLLSRAEGDQEAP